MKNLSRALMVALLASTASFTLVSCGQPADETQVSQDQQQTESERLYAWFDETFEEDVLNSPITQSYFGRKDNYGEWDDFSDAEAVRQNEITKERLEKLKTFDFDALTEEAQLSYRLAEMFGKRNLEQFKYRYHGYPINQFFGWHTQFPAFMMNIHRVADKSDAEAYVSRLETVKVTFDEIIKFMQTAQDKGITPPNWVHPYVLEANANVLSGAPFDDSGEDSGLLADLKTKIGALDIPDEEKQELIARGEAALLSQVKPAYEELSSFIEAQMEVASADDGVWKLPDGDAFYAQRLKNFTTTDLSASEIHQIGLDNVARIHDEMRAIMTQVGFEGTLQDFFEFMRTDPQFYYENTDEGRARYLAEATAIIDTMRAALPDYFGILPKADIVVKRVEPFRESSTARAFYQRPAPDGSRPGTYYANFRDMADMPIYQMQALAYHEGIPGHHMQVAISLELENVPEFQKQSGFAAYTEGWGLYSEYLPKEMGFYQDPYSDFGRLAMELWRACRLVVDTGIHSKKWTRQEAMQYLRDNTPNPEGDIENAINRYVVLPGQATAYLIGKIKILELREWARAELGDDFDLRAYHDEVLRQGAVPLNILEENIHAWVKNLKAAS